MSGQWIGLAGPFASPWEITTFDYPMIQGKPPILKVRVGKAYLIQIMASWCGPCKKGLNRIKKLLEEDSSGFPIEFLVVSVDSSKQSLLEYLSKNQDVTPVAWDPNNHVSERMNQTLVPRYLVLKGKTLYPFDFPHRSGESEAYYEDLVWFVRHCGNGQLYPASPGKTP